MLCARGASARRDFTISDRLHGEPPPLSVPAPSPPPLAMDGLPLQNANPRVFAPSAPSAGAEEDLLLLDDEEDDGQGSRRRAPASAASADCPGP